MRKIVLFISLVLSFLSLTVFAFKFKINSYCSAYSKDFDRLTLGLGTEFFFLKSTGFYMEYTYNTTINPEFSYTKLPSIFRGFHLSAGMELRLPLIRSSQLSELNLYAKGGVRYIRGYRRVFEKKNQW